MRLFLFAFPLLSLAATLEQDLSALVKFFPGRVGVCVQTSSSLTCLRAQERFSLQSVMKLPAAFAVLDAVDAGHLRLAQPVTLRPQDLSIGHQPLRNHVDPSGFTTTIGDLVRRAIIDSDNAAVDFLIQQLGGPAAVQQALTRKGFPNLRVDRQEKVLQAEISGLTWRSEFSDADVLARAEAALPKAVRARAYARYQKDPRDTTSPRDMTEFLLRLAQGQLLGPDSTRFLMQALEDCSTGTDRLKAGLAPGWRLAHKTGTSSTWNGVAAATNDVGLLLGPNGQQIAIAVFVGDSTAAPAQRASVIARLAAATIAHYR